MLRSTDRIWYRAPMGHATDVLVVALAVLSPAALGCASLPSPTMAPLTALTRPPPEECRSGQSITCQFLTGAPKSVKTPTASVAYQVFGHGEPLVLIHGWPLNRYTWRKMLPYLTEQFTVYLIDVPGAGDTVWTEETDFTWPGQGKTMKAVVDGLGLNRYYLFAQDSGAVIARELALIDGDRIIKLAMANTEVPGHRPPQAWSTRRRRCRCGPRSSIGCSAASSTIPRSCRPARALATASTIRRTSSATFRKYILKPIVDDPVRSEGHRRFLAGWDWEELDSLKGRHASIKMPVLFVWGEDDRTFPLSQAEEMKTQFPNFAGIVRISKARLLVHEGAPSWSARCSWSSSVDREMTNAIRRLHPISRSCT